MPHSPGSCHYRISKCHGQCIAHCTSSCIIIYLHKYLGGALRDASKANTNTEFAVLPGQYVRYRFARMMSRPARRSSRFSRNRYVRSDTEIEQNQMHPYPFTYTVYVRPAPDGAARQALAVSRVQSWGLCTPALVNGNACRCSETSPLALRLSTLRRALDPRPCTLPVRLPVCRARGA